MAKITKLVLPVAGLGKRLRPLTFKTPKNLIKLNGKPLLEYALEEAKPAGIKEVILIISPEHRRQFEQYLAAARKKFPDLTFHIRIQEEPLGNGHAILQAADLAENESFAVRFCDDIIIDKSPLLEALINFYEICNAPLILLERVPREEVCLYGVVKVKKINSQPFLYQVFDVIEKPKIEEAPSDLIIVGGYILTPAIMSHLSRLENSKKFTPDNELWLTDAFRAELKAGGKLYGWEFSGKRFDCGKLTDLKKAEEFMAGGCN